LASSLKSLTEKLKTVELVIFDKDGLIIDSEREVYESWKTVLSENNLNFSDEWFSTIVGIRIEDRTKILFRQFGKLGLEMQKATLNLIHQNRYDTIIPLKKGLKELLETLSYLNIKKVVATSSTLLDTKRTLGVHNILEEFDLIVTGELVEFGKPAPDIFLKCSELMNVSPSKCLVLEDSDAGINAAKSAGMIAILVPDLAKNSAEVVNMSDAVLDNLLEVVNLFTAK